MLITTWLFYGCASFNEVPIGYDLKEIQNYQVKARVGVNFEGKGYSAKIFWRHKPNEDSILVYSAIGTILATIQADKYGAKFKTKDKELYRSKNMASLTQELIGWHLPFEDLKFWIVGESSHLSNVSEKTFDEDGRLLILKQEGWLISYKKYEKNGALPKIIDLKHTDMRMRIFIDKWEFPDQ